MALRYSFSTKENYITVTKIPKTGTYLKRETSK